MRRLIFWEWPRTSWQYDLIVVGILAFIFLTPRTFFRDQPKASDLVRLPAQVAGTSVFWIDGNLLDSLPENQRARRVESLLRSRFGRTTTVVHLEPVPESDSNMDLKGYVAHTKP
ncbi:MAG TPA: hypothetical protein VE621_07535 [Bryobacteraceae bacterium]|jgi:hypothetical protein|nr:hypothetical protein [Bryobacteraceae bacterium]